MLGMDNIYWFCNNQNSVETSTFGSEFVALKQCCEYIRGIWYQIRIIAIPVEDPDFIYRDNHSVVIKYNLPEYTINNKINSITDHFVREGSAKAEWRCGRVGTDDNPSDLMTKSSISGDSRIRKVQMLIYDI